MSSSDSKILGVPKVTCLCATKGRYELLRSAVSYFLLQDYPNKELLIFNNHPEPIKLSSFVEEQHNIHIINAGEFSSIADVYNTALTYVDTWGGPPTEFVAIWDDDDIYFPWHLSTGLKHLVKGTHHAWQPREQLYIDASYEHYPKINAIRNHCEGSMVVKYSTLSSVGFGPASNADEHGQQHPHPRWCERINELGGFTYSEKDENSYAYFWGGQEDRQKPWYVHLTNGGFEGNTQNNNTGDGSPLYPGPTYYDFISKNLYLKKYDEEYTAEEKEAVVTRLDSYDWSFFEERKLFTFWEGEKPYFIERCLESMEKNSNCIFEVWDTEKLKQTYSDIPKEYDSLTVESKSDYFRQKVLYEEGGMWLDADMFIVGDLYESIMKYTWWYDQVQPLENPDCNSINICAMACRPRSQVFKKALESVNAIMPLNTTGWADLINYSAKYAIRERDCRGLVKYIPETVISLKFVQNLKGGFSELYSSTEMSLDEIVLPDTAVVTLHSSQIRHEEKDIMPKDYLLQRLIDTYCPSTLPQTITRLTDRNEMDNLIRSLESPVIAEVGVQAGTNFQLLLTENVKEAVAVDIWDKSETVAQNDQGYSKETLEGLYINFVRHHMADARVKVFKGFSVDVAKVFPDGYFDFIYIDADHTYEGCLADLRAWYPKIKQGGIIAGHDYIDIVGGHNDDVPFGVIQAVTEFSNQHVLDVHITKESFASYFMVKPMTTSFRTHGVG
jgi:cephalosporin hydroxylase